MIYVGTYISTEDTRHLSNVITLKLDPVTLPVFPKKIEDLKTHLQQGRIEWSFKSIEFTNLVE